MEQDDKAESNRARVRRLLIDPCQERGMRFRKGTPDDVCQRDLNRMCDELAYLGDDHLGLLAD